MYFITKKDSVTGKKFAAISEKRKQCHKAQKELALRYGFNQWWQAYGVVFGGISGCLFDKEPDTKIWKYVKYLKGWMPKIGTSEGKKIMKEFNNLPHIANEELNACIGWDEDCSTIGYAKNKSLYGFVGFDDWKIDVPDDCEEVTISKYKELFGDFKKN